MSTETRECRIERSYLWAMEMIKTSEQFKLALKAKLEAESGQAADLKTTIEKNELTITDIVSIATPLEEYACYVCPHSSKTLWSMDYHFKQAHPQEANFGFKVKDTLSGREIVIKIVNKDKMGRIMKTEPAETANVEDLDLEIQTILKQSLAALVVKTGLNQNNGMEVSQGGPATVSHQSQSVLSEKSLVEPRISCKKCSEGFLNMAALLRHVCIKEKK